MNLSKREKVLLGILLFAIVFGLYFFYLFLPRFQEFQDHRQLLEQKEQELHQIYTLDDSGQLETQLEEANHMWSDAENKIPSYMKLPDLYMNLLDLQNRAGISYNLLEFGTMEKASEEVQANGATLSKISINMVFTGTYQQVDAFLESLYGNERKLEITKIHYENNEGKLNVTMGANAFALLKENDAEWSEYDFVQGKSYGKSDPFTGGDSQNTDEKKEDNSDSIEDNSSTQDNREE